ncbi:MAG: DUF2085 domain-containing protein, partial [Chloroflexi bacterium]|nr:DUF2085 domain-containing protein [Chloroflexota bacterium]
RYYLDDISPRRQAIDRAIVDFVDEVAGFVGRHWLLLLNISSGLIFFGTFLVPLLYKLGQTWIASPLFIAYRLLCVQNPDHSYFIFGYQMAMDQRMTAIFGSFFATGVIFAAIGRNVRPLSWRMYFLLILPIAVDGFTQLFGWRHSNWQLRTLTGGLFGMATVWLAIPQLQAYAARVRQETTRRHR